jgi:hypothetical protein
VHGPDRDESRLSGIDPGGLITGECSRPSRTMLKRHPGGKLGVVTVYETPLPEAPDLRRRQRLAWFCITLKLRSFSAWPLSIPVVHLLSLS